MKLPKWESLKTHYPALDAGVVFKGIGGKVELNYGIRVFKNACAIRVSKALNGSGGAHLIPYFKAVGPTGELEPQVSSGKNGQWYIFRVKMLYSSNTNISFFHSADEFEIVRQQRTQFALIFARISEEFLTSGFEFGKRFEVLVVQGFLLEEFPEAFDQIQIRRIGREEYELDA